MPSGNIDYPKPGETTRVDKTEILNTEATLHDGGVLVKVIALSIDPYLRSRMHDPNTPFESYLWYNMDAEQAAQLRVIKNDEKLPWSTYLGVLGMPGQTAYIGWKQYSQAKKGETVFVTSAAGAVGSFVVQLAKAQGLTVIASAGSDDKVEFVQDIGADVGLENGIDIYWDNVGSEMVDAALQAMNNFGRIICCGAIASYNTPNRYGIKNMHQVVEKRLTFNGFIMNDLAKDYLPDFYKTYPRMVASGKIKHREQLYYGFDGAEQALADIQKGENIAKPVVMILDEEGSKASLPNGGTTGITSRDGTLSANES
ncbi:hypothetical protein Clacol_009530 [Clathrus columnatus]|uniref:Enoyl reductase (ER) domain-containing protein n=1 Tax=Clathrus columnatus TaxID=1419009 RepID=A0AAV5AKV5_9AGAM|nr:hypothetical protein Clacol_009530 [Clathrus columnatus]